MIEKKGISTEIWKKKTTSLHKHKKEDKVLIKNHCVISLVPIFGKISEKVIYNSLFNNFLSNKFFTQFQSSFPPGDSCIAQLLLMIHEIHTAFDHNPTVDVRHVFLDISKALTNFGMMVSFLSSVRGC